MENQSTITVDGETYDVSLLKNYLLRKMLKQGMTEKDCTADVLEKMAMEAMPEIIESGYRVIRFLQSNTSESKAVKSVMARSIYETINANEAAEGDNSSE